jgi:hypothetical protein
MGGASFAGFLHGFGGFCVVWFPRVQVIGLQRRAWILVNWALAARGASPEEKVPRIPRAAHRGTSDITYTIIHYQCPRCQAQLLGQWGKGPATELITLLDKPLAPAEKCLKTVAIGPLASTSTDRAGSLRAAAVQDKTQCQVAGCHVSRLCLVGFSCGALYGFSSNGTAS